MPLGTDTKTNETVSFKLFIQRKHGWSVYINQTKCWILNLASIGYV